MIVRKEIICDCTLYLGDCREILPTLGKVDAVVTDPPYGVGFTGKRTKHSDNSGRDSYADNESSIDDVVLPALDQALKIAKRGAIFSGNASLRKYPQYADLGGIICPNGGGRSPWGFGCFNPILFFGKSPYLEVGEGSRPTAAAIYHPGMHVTGEAIGNDHPCPKPLAFMLWTVRTASREAETVLDPFMGSGTTGVACVKLGRKFIGIEIEPKYFDIACKRIRDAYAQPDFFVAPPAPKPEQLSLLESNP